MSIVGRNTPCPCGSGRKYKKCCGRTAGSTGASTVGSSEGRIGGASASAPDGTYMRFRVSLRFTRPEVWRRFLLRADASFLDLHDAIQACGWTESHLWQFSDSSHDVIAGIPDEESLFGRPTPDAAGVPLAAFFRSPETACTYTYDFGDSWEHDVVLEAIEERGARTETFERALLDGAGAFPPEDCGGIPGYARILEFMATGVDPWEDAESASDLAGILCSRPFELAAEAARFGAVLDDPTEERFEQEPSPSAKARRVETIDRATMDRIVARVEPVLAQLGDELGLRIGVRHGSFTSVNARLEVEAATVRDDGVVMDKLAVQFLEGCREFGLDPEDLGSELTQDGERLRVIGLRPRARLPVVCETVRGPAGTGPERIRLSAVFVRESLARGRAAGGTLRLLPREGAEGSRP